MFSALGCRQTKGDKNKEPRGKVNIILPRDFFIMHPNTSGLTDYGNRVLIFVELKIKIQKLKKFDFTQNMEKMEDKYRLHNENNEK